MTVNSQKIDVNNNRSNYLPHQQMKKVNVDFYRPSSALNPNKYQPQYATKPPSSPINSSKTVRFDSYRSISPHQRQGSVVSSSYNNNNNTNRSTTSFNNRLTVDYYHNRQQHYQPSIDRSTYSKSSMDNSAYSGQSKSTTNRVAYQGYDMKKSKPKYEVTKLNDLGNKIDFLKS